MLISNISIFYEIKPPIPYMGLHPLHPLIQFTPFKFDKFSLKTLKSWDFRIK